MRSKHKVETLGSVCKVCGHEEFVQWGTHGNGLILYRCKNCGLVFLYPYPIQEQLNKFYDDNYHKERGYDGNTRAGELRRKMYELDMRDLKRYIPLSQGTLLDVGCAEGLFLSLLDDGWEKYGIDVSEKTVQSAKTKGLCASTKDISEFEDLYFDVVHLRGVFEHILDPVKFISVAHKKIKKKGYLVISNTPNISGIVPFLYRGAFRLVLPNEHVNYYCTKTMEILLDKTGFRIMKITYPYFGTPYCSFFKDVRDIVLNKWRGEKSPPFFGNIFTIYAQKR